MTTSSNLSTTNQPNTPTGSNNMDTMASPSVSLSNLIALPEGLASNAAGLAAWWKFTGNVVHTELDAAWVKEGLDSDWLQPLPSAKVALTRAVEEIVRRSASRKKHHVADAHWMVYDVKADEDKTDADFSVELHVKLTDDRKGIEVTPKGHHMEQEILELLRENQTRLESRDMGAWFPKLIIDKLNAVSLVGGPHFIPPESVATFGKMARAIEAVSNHTISEMQAVRNDKAVAAVLEGLVAEAQAQADVVEEALDLPELDAKRMQGRGFRTAHNACESMMTKIEKYEKLLEANLDSMRDKLTDLAAASAEAAIVADDKAADERAKAKREGK